MRTRALAPAVDELASTADYLEAKRRGAGRQFLRAYREAFNNIKRFPQMYSLAEDEVPGHEIRNAILERFDYRVVYLVRPDEAVILTVAHTSRRPGHWHRRLDDETLS